MENNNEKREYLIYCATNKINGKQYVGMTKNLKNRISNHYYTGKIINNKVSPIASEMSEYYNDDFIFEIIKKDLTKTEALIEEQYQTNKINTYYPRGYNNMPTQIRVKNLQNIYSKTKPQHYKASSSLLPRVVYSTTNNLLVYCISINLARKQFKKHNKESFFSFIKRVELELYKINPINSFIFPELLPINSDCKTKYSRSPMQRASGIKKMYEDGFISKDDYDEVYLKWVKPFLHTNYPDTSPDKWRDSEDNAITKQVIPTQIRGKVQSNPMRIPLNPMVEKEKVFVQSNNLINKEMSNNGVRRDSLAFKAGYFFGNVMNRVYNKGRR